MITPHYLAAAQNAAQNAAPAAAHSQPVTDVASRIGWVVGLLLFVTLLYWLMRQGWKWRGTLQGDLPALPTAPEPADDTSEDGATLLTMAGRYHGSTTAGQWLDRIVAHGLGTRSRAGLTLSLRGLDVRRPGAQDFFIPVGQLRGARLEKGIAGKVLTEGGLLVVTWEHGGRLIDSGFRSDQVAGHPEWAERLTAVAGADAAVSVNSGAGTGSPSTNSSGSSTASTGTGDSGVPGRPQPVRTTQKGTP